MKNNVYICDTKDKYQNKPLNISKIYSELIGIDVLIDGDKEIYDDVRNMFINMGLNKKNIGTDKWNPFSDFIKKGDHVVIKPNLVFHQNINGTTDSLITNFSIIRPMIDYTILALGDTGQIIVGENGHRKTDTIKSIFSLFHQLFQSQHD